MLEWEQMPGNPCREPCKLCKQLSVSVWITAHRKSDCRGAQMSSSRGPPHPQCECSVPSERTAARGQAQPRAECVSQTTRLSPGSEI